MNSRHVLLIVVLLIGYALGAKFPALAGKVGLA